MLTEYVEWCIIIVYLVFDEVLKLERIHKIIIAVLGVILIAIMVVGIVFTATRDKSDKTIVNFKSESVSTTTTPKATTTTSAATTTTATTTTTTTATQPKPIFSVVAQDVNVNEGETATIEMKLSDGFKISDLEFSSTDESVATVDENANVTGVSLGECKIKIKYDDNEVNIGVKVGDEYGTVVVEKRNIFTNSCHFRQGPDTTYTSMGVFALNTEVTIIGENGDWWKIDYDGKIGFVSKDYVSDTKY